METIGVLAFVVLVVVYAAVFAWRTILNDCAEAKRAIDEHGEVCDRVSALIDDLRNRNRLLIEENESLVASVNYWKNARKQT